MNGKGIFNVIKKPLIVIMIFITMGFAMPKKSEADLLNDFVNLLLYIPDGIMYVVDDIIAGSPEFTFTELDFTGMEWNGNLYNFMVTPYEIFTSGKYEVRGGAYYTKIGWLDVNFFSDRKINSDTEVSSNILGPVVANIYRALRDLCMILMLLVVLYIGIKIMVSSIAEQQAKYKKFLIDWLVGFALLFTMHYIMAGIMNINSVIVNMLSNEEGDSYYVGLADLEADGQGYSGAWLDILNDDYGSTGMKVFTFGAGGGDKKWNKGRFDNFKDNRICVEGTNDRAKTYAGGIEEGGRLDLSRYNNLRHGLKKVELNNWGDKGVIYLSASIGDDDDSKYNDKAIVKLNAMSYIRTVSSIGSNESEAIKFYKPGKSGYTRSNKYTVLGHSILYLCLVIEVIMFLFVYMKRVVQMAFLTMIAPLVAIMYPIDKLGDGKAQAFNTWFKDYLFNMLVQPMHLLLYTVFIVAAGQLMSRNIIYALVMYGFMIPAEKYFKKILGFEKASNGGGGPLGNAIGHGLAMEGLGKLAGIGPAGKGGKGGGSDGGSRRKPKLNKIKNPDVTRHPASAGADAGGDGVGGIFKPKADSVDTSKKPESSGSGDKKDKKGSPFLRTLGKKAIRGATGGRYGNLSDIKNPKAWGKAAGRLGGFAARTAGKGILRGAGIAAMGSVGVVAGAATAMATGDINNLWRGAAVGAAAGNKIGGNLYNKAEGFVGDFAAEERLERAAMNPDYNAKLLTEQTHEDMREVLSNMSSEDYENATKIIDKMAPYCSIKDEKDIDALEAIMGDSDNSQGYTREYIANTFTDAKKCPDLQSQDNREDYMRNMLANPKNYEVDEKGRKLPDPSNVNTAAIMDAFSSGTTSYMSDTDKEVYNYLVSRMQHIQAAQKKLK